MLYNAKIKSLFIYYADFETVVVDNNHYVTCYSFCDAFSNVIGSNCIDSLNVDNIEIKSYDLLDKFINLCFTTTEPKTSFIYFHNLSRFDGIFIVNYFINSTIYDISLIIKDNSIYEITLKKKKYYSFSYF